MKARTSFAVVVFLLLSGSTRGGNVDKAKLRELAKLPKVSIVFGAGYSSITSFGFGEKPDHLAEIARLQKLMKGDPSDAERYLLLARHYSVEKREKEAKEACAKAVALCRRQVSEHPGDIGWKVRLGDALHYNGEAKEAEKLLRCAVHEAPDNWRAWFSLAEFVDDRSFQAILGEKGFPVAFHADKLMFPALAERNPTPEQIAEMRRIANEARGYYNRTIELAPRDEANTLFRRYFSNWQHGFVEAGLRAIKGERFNPMAGCLAPDSLADIEQLARLSHDDPKVVGSAMLWVIMACVSDNRLEMKADLSSLAEARAVRMRSLVDVLPLESRTFVRWCLERLETLTKHTDKATAASASEILADSLMAINGMGEESGASFPLPAKKAETRPIVVEHLRRAVRLDPSREHAWDFLTLKLVREHKIAEAIAAARKRLEIKDNAANRFVLARVYADDKQFDKAAEQLQAGLKSDPNNLLCRLGLIALLLKREDATSLKEAGEQLGALQPRIEETKNGTIWQSYHGLCGIHSALTDHPEWAMGEFQKILHRKKGDETAMRAIVALGEVLGAADQQLAVDYIKEQRGQVAGKDSPTSLPVERIALNRDFNTDADLFVLTAFPQLHELNLSFTAITDAGLAGLKNLPALRRLVVDGTNITDKGLIALMGMRELNYLSLNRTNITDTGLSHLEALPNLEWLAIDDVDGSEDRERITDGGLAHLRKLPKLQAVTVGSSITDKGLAHLAAIPRLRSLRMLSSKITDEGMKHLEQLAALEVLWLSDANITDAGFAHLKGLRNLKELHLGGTRITDAGLVNLKELARLEELELDGTAISDVGLKSLSGLTRLRKLNLGDRERKRASADSSNNPQLTGEGLKYLQGLTQLNSLALDGRPLTDAALSGIEPLSHLEYLSLGSTNITDAGLVYLQRLKQLRLVNVKNTQVTPHGIAQLREALPKLEIYR